MRAASFHWESPNLPPIGSEALEQNPEDGKRAPHLRSTRTMACASLNSIETCITRQQPSIRTQDVFEPMEGTLWDIQLDCGLHRHISRAEISLFWSRLKVAVRHVLTGLELQGFGKPCRPIVQEMIEHCARAFEGAGTDMMEGDISLVRQRHNHTLLI